MTFVLSFWGFFYLFHGSIFEWLGWCSHNFTFNYYLHSLFTHHSCFFLAFCLLFFWLWPMLFQQLVYSPFLFWGENFLHSVGFGSFLARREHLYTCTSHSTAQVWHLSLSPICFYSIVVVRWSADLLPTAHWSVSMSGFIYISLRQRWSQFPAKIHVLTNTHLPLHHYLVQCNFPSHRVWIKIQNMPLFFNQRYKSVPLRHVIYLL